MTLREQTQQREEAILSPYACRSSQSRGRERPEEECPIRTPFQRDTDRIVYSKAFRRLKHKTQVFLQPEGDHYRTRMTHTLEVSRIARTIARALSLNEDLTEAVALGHDLGHTPFGHAGERAAGQADAGRLCPLQAVGAGGGAAGKERRGAEPDLGGAQRHPLPHQGAPGRHPGGAGGPSGRPHRLYQPRH